MYVAVKGGEKAIDAAHALQESRRRGDTDLPELSVAQIEQQLNLAVDRVMTEGGIADRELAALAIKQAAEGGIVAAEYQEHFGEHAYDAEGNYIGGAFDESTTSEGQEAWEQYYAEQGEKVLGPVDKYLKRHGINFTTAVKVGSAGETIAKVADAGKFDTITRRINGGQNGATDRQALYDKALKVLA